MLTVPAPTLAFDPLPTGLAPLEMPLMLRIADAERDGVALGIADLRVAGFHVFRWLNPGAMTEVWYGDAGSWLPDAAADYAVVPPQALIYEAGQPLPWQGILVPAAGTDRT